MNREKFLAQYGLDPKYKYFAICGFFAPYKGHLTAMRALECLPEDWRLVVVGGEHPHSLEADRDIGRYVGQLLSFPLAIDRPPDGSLAIENLPHRWLDKDEEESLPRRLFNNDEDESLSRRLLNGRWAPTGAVVRGDQVYQRELRHKVFKHSEFKYFLPTVDIKHRIHYLGQASDEDMPRFYAMLDYVVHPYMRTKEGQSGSGPATFAVEFGSRALFSNAPVFREMGQYFEGAMQFFNIGNFMELAGQLQRFKSFEPALACKREAALKVYNPKGMVDAYRRLIEV